MHLDLLGLQAIATLVHNSNSYGLWPMEVSWVIGVTQHHPWKNGVFHEINHPAMGVPLTMDTSICRSIVKKKTMGLTNPLLTGRPTLPPSHFHNTPPSCMVNIIMGFFCADMRGNIISLTITNAFLSNPVPRFILIFNTHEIPFFCDVIRR